MVYILFSSFFLSSSFAIKHVSLLPKKSPWISVPCPPSANLQSNLHQNLHPNQPRLVAMLGSFGVLLPTQHKTVPWDLWVRALTGFFWKESWYVVRICRNANNSCLFHFFADMKNGWLKFITNLNGPNRWYILLWIQLETSSAFYPYLSISPSHMGVSQPSES